MEEMLQQKELFHSENETSSSSLSQFDMIKEIKLKPCIDGFY